MNDVIPFRVKQQKSIPRTGGGTLYPHEINELQDAGAYLIPLANSLPAEHRIRIILLDTFSAFEPSLPRSGTDLIRNVDGTSTVINFDGNVRVDLEIITNGVDEWRT